MRNIYDLVEKLIIDHRLHVGYVVSSLTDKLILRKSPMWGAKNYKYIAEIRERVSGDGYLAADIQIEGKHIIVVPSGLDHRPYMRDIGYGVSIHSTDDEDFYIFLRRNEILTETNIPVLQRLVFECV